MFAKFSQSCRDYLFFLKKFWTTLIVQGLFKLFKEILNNTYHVEIIQTFQINSEQRLLFRNYINFLNSEQQFIKHSILLNLLLVPEHYSWYLKVHLKSSSKTGCGVYLVTNWLMSNDISKINLKYEYSDFDSFVTWP